MRILYVHGPAFTGVALTVVTLLSLTGPVVAEEPDASVNAVIKDGSPCDNPTQ